MIDVQRFGELRMEIEREHEVLALFAGAGFAPPTLFLDLGTGGRYYLFEGSDAAEKDALPTSGPSRGSLQGPPIRWLAAARQGVAEWWTQRRPLRFSFLPALVAAIALGLEPAEAGLVKEGLEGESPIRASRCC